MFAKMLKKTKAIIMIPVLTLAMLGNVVTASAENLPYDTYNYDYWDNIVFTPAAYVPNGSISGTDIGVGSFSNPQDVCVADDGKIYICDTGKNRIVVLNSDMKTVDKVIESFDNEGVTDTFSSPYGVFVSSKNELYIADSENRRIVVLDSEGNLVRFVQNPQSEVLEDDYVFTPLKVTVDYADRVYVVAKGMFEGIMVFDEDGQFTGYSGTINVKITMAEKIWRKLSTKAQRSGQILYVPTEFTGIDVDDDGFVYATNVDSEGVQAVRRLNPKGEDVIKMGKSGNLGGDRIITGSGAYAGASNIVDVKVREKGMYSVLDSRRGRVFTYDHEGNLLYIFGGLGTQSGTFITPVAIEAFGGNILVLDANQRSLLIFSATEYGTLINDAIALRYDGDETQAVEKWKEVLKLDANNELANTGIGKAYLTAGDNKSAMKYLKIGMDRTYYSVAFKRYRNEFLKSNLGYILTGAIVLIVALWILAKVIKKKKAEKGVMENE